MNERRRRSLTAAAAFVALVALGVAAALVVGERDDEGAGGGDRPREGGTLRMGVVGVQSLDPAEARDPTEVMVADFLFDGLVGYDPVTLDAVPALAESWDVSADQRQFTFRLREGATFHDGSPILAADVKATLDRIARPGSTSDFRFHLDTVAGYEAWHAEGEGGGLAGVEAVDDRTVVVRLDQPFAQLPVVLGSPGFGVVPAAAAGAPGFADAPVGSGPFRFLAAAGDVVRLARFRAYRPRAAYLDQIELHRRESPQAAYDDLLDGGLDLAPVPADKVGDAERRFEDAGLRPRLAVLFYGLNLRSEKLADIRLRRAVVAAVDRARIVDLVYGEAATVVDAVVPAGAPGGVDDACGDRCAHDPGRARRLLAEAFPDGRVPEIAIDFDDDDVQRAIAGAIQADLEAVGVPTRMRPHDFVDYGPFVVSGEQELFRLGWIADYPHQDAFLYPLFVSELRDNLTGFSDAETDRLLRAARGDPGGGVSLFRQAEQRILDQYVILPIAQFVSRWAAGPDVKGLVMTALGTVDGAGLYLTSAGGG